jgi:hypothetical protein
MGLVGALADVVAGGVVAADDVDGVVAAERGGAADVGGGPPHDLRVVAAHLARGAGVGGVVVVRALAHPGRDGVVGRPRLARPPEQILPERAPGVRQRQALAPLRGREAERVRRQVGVPLERGHAHLAPRCVVRRQKRLRRVRVRRQLRAHHHHRQPRQRRNNQQRDNKPRHRSIPPTPQNCQTPISTHAEKVNSKLELAVNLSHHNAGRLL